MNKYQEAKKTVSFVPVYQRLFDEYREEILTFRLRPGTKVHSINEIQRIHGVSRETAKHVLNMLAQKGFIIQKPGKGSFVADVRPKKKMWAVVLPLYSAQYEYLLENLSQKAWGLGREFRHFIDYNSWKEEIRLVSSLINECYEAVIVVPTQNEHETSSFYSRLASQGTFVALMDHTITGSWFPYVIQSYDLGVQRGMRYLAENTCGKIVFVCNQVWADRNVVQEMMEETYKRFVGEEKERGTPLVITSLNRIDVDFLRSENISGFFCCDDAEAVRIMGQLREHGINIPGEARLVSYGNTAIARYFTPAITSIDPHSEEMSETMAGIVERRIAGENVDYCQYVVQPTLVIRDT